MAIEIGRAIADCKLTLNARLAPQYSPMFSSQHPSNATQL